MNKPTVKLSGVDGNVYSIIGEVTKALRKAGMNDAAKEFQEEAFNSESYNAVLQLCFKYCEVI
jgi:hypothetical protein